jgi:hypothetical protein
VYPSIPQGRGGSRRHNGDKDLDVRLLRLERLVGSIAAKRQRHDANAEDGAKVNGDLSLQEPAADGLGLDGESDAMLGRLVADNDQSVYVSANHWAAICDEVGSPIEFTKLLATSAANRSIAS